MKIRLKKSSLKQAIKKFVFENTDFQKLMVENLIKKTQEECQKFKTLLFDDQDIEKQDGNENFSLLNAFGQGRKLFNVNVTRFYKTFWYKEHMFKLRADSLNFLKNMPWILNVCRSEDKELRLIRFSTYTNFTKDQVKTLTELLEKIASRTQNVVQTKRRKYEIKGIQMDNTLSERLKQYDEIVSRCYDGMKVLNQISQCFDQLKQLMEQSIPKKSTSKES